MLKSKTTRETCCGKRNKLVQSYIDGILTGSKMYEIIAAFSLCLDDLTTEEIIKVNKRFPDMFYIGERPDKTNCIYLKEYNERTRTDFFGYIEDDNNKRRIDDKRPIEFDSSRICFL